jgi:hypothetical protein
MTLHLEIFFRPFLLIKKDRVSCTTIYNVKLYLINKYDHMTILLSMIYRVY